MTRYTQCTAVLSRHHGVIDNVVYVVCNSGEVAKSARIALPIKKDIQQITSNCLYVIVKFEPLIVCIPAAKVTHPRIIPL